MVLVELLAVGVGQEVTSVTAAAHGSEASGAA
jgi:hypothetical protein